MNDTITEELLAKLSSRIHEQMGLHFQKKNWNNLKRGLKFAAPEFGFDNTTDLARCLLSTPFTNERINTLAGHLTIGETYFFREIQAFDALTHSILPELISARRHKDQRLRIWSAGCSSGEEAYSIAIMLTRLLPDIRDWSIRILATDLNPASLQKAVKGVYTEWSFRNPPLWCKAQYFQKVDKGYEIMPAIKQMVTFFPLNLAQDMYPSLTNDTNAIDVIFCRNVLMYFSDDLRKRVIQNFHHALIDGGWLLVSPSEVNSELFPRFRATTFPGVIFFRKELEQPAIQEIWSTPQADMPELSYPFPNQESPEPQTPSFLESPLFQQQETSVLFRDRDVPRLSQEDEHQNIFQYGSSEQVVASLSSQERYDKALTLYQQGQYVDTINTLSEMSSVSTHPEAIELLIRAYANLGKLTDALEWCQKALLLDSLNPCLHYLKATILIEENRLSEANTALRHTLFLDPNFVLASLASGNLALQQGRLKESRKHFDNLQGLLHTYHTDEVIPESEGMTAGRLLEIVKTMLAAEA